MLEGLKVLDLSWGSAGPVTTMLLADQGASVVKVEPPGGDPFRGSAGYEVWNRGKQSVVLDLHHEAGRAEFLMLAAAADVLVESFSPGTTARLGIDEPTLRRLNEGLVYCSITGYGSAAPGLRDRPGYDALVQARMGLQYDQPGLRSGPIFLHTQLPSFGAAFLASVGIRAALVARAALGRGQLVETSLAQGALLWTTQVRKRAERPTASLHDLWRFVDLPPTPCFEAGDGKWFHPMPQAIPAALAHVGLDPASINLAHIATGTHEERSACFAAMRELYLMRPMEEWVAVVQGADVPCQPVGPTESAFDHPQLVHNGAVCTVDNPRLGPVTQFGRAFRIDEVRDPISPAPPPVIGQHTTPAVLARWAGAPDFRPDIGSTRVSAGAGPLAGLRVLDFGTQLAGPFAPMILGDLGADVIKIDPYGFVVGSQDESTWVACQRGKRSITVNLKAPGGQEIARKLIETADVIHYNLRTGVAERLGFGYEQVKAINPDIIFCHVTSYGGSGPLALYPGVDQMGQAVCGLEWEQGATDAGGHPTWYRFGMCDATASMCSVTGVLEALLHRGSGPHRVDADILTGALLLASDAMVGPGDLPTRPHLDRQQMGLAPLYRLYRTSDDWICIAAVDDRHWTPLCEALGRGDLTADARFVDRAGRTANGAALAAEIEAVMATGPSARWFHELDRRGVPCEIPSATFGTTFYDDPDAIASGWVVGFEHPVWGHLEQPGRFLDLSLTPVAVAGPPPVLGSDTRSVLADLGYEADSIERLVADRVIG